MSVFTKRRNITFLLGFGTVCLLLFSGCHSKTVASSAKKYTYNSTDTSPQTWNPTDWQMGSEANVLGYTGMGLYDFIMNKNKDNYEVVCEMAAAFPVDVTKEYAGKPVYALPADADHGYAWKIDLNKKACWEDGTPITADDYVYSSQQFLNPKMKNYRASSWYEGITGLVNAKAYYSEEKDASWDKVGLIKNNDYSITFILKNPTTKFFIEYGLASCQIVKKDLYEANKKQTGDIIKSSYGTSKETYMSCGPYKIASYQEGKEIKYTRNENWYGYKDGNHKGQFQTTGIFVQFIDKHETVTSLFLQGKLDDLGLTASEMEKYGNSDFITYSPTSVTWKITMNSDLKSLQKEDKKGINHSILSNKDFRHALFLALNRQEYVSTIMVGDESAFGLINHAYICNPETSETYREDSYAKQALCDVYGVKNADDITGYNPEEAKKLFETAYKTCVKNGILKTSDKIELDYHVYSDSETNIRTIEFLQNAIDKACSDTELNGKITIKQVIDENYYDNIKKGAVDLATTAWGGGSFDPYSVLWCYSTDEAKKEYGFNPDKEKLTINLNGKDITKTYHEWYTALCEGEYVTADADMRNKILAENEKGLLLFYNMIPLSYDRSCALISHRIIQGSEDYINTLVGHGGIRFMTYSMDDDAWNAYCQKNNNQLNY